MKSFRLTTILLIAVVILGGIYLLSPEYLRNVALHLYPDIDDYEHFDCRTVISGTPDPWKESPGFSNRELAPGFNEILEEYKTVSFLVAREGSIVYERYRDGYGRKSLTGTFSMTKSVVSLLVGIAIDKSFIDSVDQPAADFIPEFSQGNLNLITIRHLLEMSSGLSWEDSYISPFGKTARAYYGDNLRELVLAQEAFQKPGEFFRYQNANTQLLAIILEKSCGMSVSAFASQNLWQKVGAEEDALWTLDKVNGMEKAFAGFTATARDMARLGQLVLNGGAWRGTQVVSTGYLVNSLQPADHLTDKNGNRVSYYGWHWWMHEQDGINVFSMRGLGGQYLMVIPEKDLVIVRFGEKGSKDLDEYYTPSDLINYVKIGMYAAGFSPGSP